MRFDGYRWDAARHVPRWYWKDHILNNVNAWGKYSFGEVPRNNAIELQSYVDIGMAVTDEMLYAAMYHNFGLGGNLAALDGGGYAAINGAKTALPSFPVHLPPYSRLRQEDNETVLHLGSN
jgi:alpha-amylase